MAAPLRAGGGVKGKAINKKNFFWHLSFQRYEISAAIKVEGGRGVRP